MEPSEQNCSVPSHQTCEQLLVQSISSISLDLEANFCKSINTNARMDKLDLQQWCMSPSDIHPRD